MAAPAPAPTKEEVFFITDAIFEEIYRRMLMAKDIQKRVGEVFQFNISKNGRPAAKTWILDMKSETPSTYPGQSKVGRPSCVIDIADEDMAALALGDLDPVKAFMSGRIRIKGNPMLTQKLDILFKLDSADAHPGVNENAGIDNAGSGAETIPLPAGAPAELKCKTDHIFAKWMLGRRGELKELVPSIGHVYLWSIVKDGQIVSEWTCDFKNGDGDIYHGSPKQGKPTCSLRLEDEDAVQIFAGQLDATKAFMSGKLKISGNVLAAQKLQKLWEDESPPPIDQLLASGNPPSSAGAVFPTDTDDFDVDKIPCSGLKCDLIFNIFKNRCHEEPDFMQRLRVLFQFNITRKGKPMCVWTADNKTQPGIQVYRQPAVGIRPDVTVTVEDEDMLKIMVGKVNPQRLFMMGKVKVKGNIMLLQKLNNLWGEYQKLGKTPELPAVVEVMMKDPIKVGLKSEATVIDLMQRVVKLPDLPAKFPGLHQFDITQNGKVASNWTLDFKSNRNTFYRGPAASEPTTQLQIDDTDFAKIVYMQLKFADVSLKFFQFLID